MAAAPGFAASNNTEQLDGLDTAGDGIATNEVPVVLLQKIIVLQIL